MAETISTVGYIGITIDLVKSTATALEAVCSRVSNEYKEPLDVRVKLLLFELRSVTSKLLEWQKIWSPKDLKSEAPFLLLWGQSGQREIRARLDKIQVPARTILELTEALETAIQSKEIGADASPGKSWFRWLFSLPFLKDNSDTIRDRLNVSVIELVSAVDKLLESTDIHFRSMHATVDTEDPEHHRLVHVLESRPVSTAIYADCKDSGKLILLDLDLLNNEKDIDKFPDIFDWHDLNLVYHFLALNHIPDTGECEATDIRLESVRTSDPSSSVEESLNSTPIDSLHPWLQQSFTKDCGLSSSKDAKAFYMKVGEIVFTGTSSGPYKSDYALPRGAQRIQKHSLSLKINLAYRIVESCLFLIGTPWLAHLSYNTIVETGRTGESDNYGIWIDFKGLQEPTTSHLPTMERQHIHQIGLVLVSIATGGLLENTNTETHAHAHAHAHAHTRLSGAINWIEANMDQTYARACKYCFAIGKGRLCPMEGQGLDTQNSPTSILTAFYTEVFLRLRDCLHGLS